METRKILLSLFTVTFVLPGISAVAKNQPSHSDKIELSQGLQAGFTDALIRDALAFGLPKEFTMAKTALSPSRRLLIVYGSLNTGSHKQEIYFFRSSDHAAGEFKPRSMLKEHDFLVDPNSHLTGISQDDAYSRFTIDDQPNGQAREVIYSIDDGRLLRGRIRRNIYQGIDADSYATFDTLDEKKGVFFSSEPLGNLRYRDSEAKSTHVDVQVKLVRGSFSKSFLTQVPKYTAKSHSRFFNILDNSGEDVEIETFAKLKDLKYVPLAQFKAPVSIEEENMTVIHTVFHPRKATFRLLNKDLKQPLDTDIVISQLGDTLDFIDADRGVTVRHLNLASLNWEYTDKNGKLPAGHLVKDVGSIKNQNVVDYVLFHPTEKSQDGDRTIVIATKTQVLVVPFANSQARVEYMPKNFGEIKTLQVDKKESEDGQSVYLVFAKSFKGKVHKVALFNEPYLTPDKNTPLLDETEKEAGSVASLDQ